MQHLLVLDFVELTWVVVEAVVGRVDNLTLGATVHLRFLLIYRDVLMRQIASWLVLFLLVELVWRGHVTTGLQQLASEGLLRVIHTLLIACSTGLLNDFHLVA